MLLSFSQREYGPYFFYLAALVIEPVAKSHRLNKHSMTDVYPQADIIVHKVWLAHLK